MIKKTLAVVLAAVMLLSMLCGCSGNKTNTTNTTNNAASNSAAAQETKEKPAEKAEEKAEAPASENAPKSSSSTTKEKVTCSMCNGTGKVKYYYGNTSSYQYGPCTSCDGKGYRYITVTNNGGSDSGKKTCPSCGKKVTSLITKRDAAGESRTWCSDCWRQYNAIMGR